jgi:hypothetical protein
MLGHGYTAPAAGELLLWPYYRIGGEYSCVTSRARYTQPILVRVLYIQPPQTFDCAQHVYEYLLYFCDELPTRLFHFRI